MRSKTSFFNPTVFWSDCRRCWPLTALYALVWLMLLPLNCLTEFAHAGPDYAPDMLYTCLAGTSAGGYISALLVGIAFAMAMFAYLCDTRATNGLHALPERRETLYVTHYLAGLCCQLMPQVAAVVLCVAVIGAHGVFDLSAMGLMLLTLILPTLFFYCFGVFCMVFTGQILAAPVFYGILNILVVGVEMLVKTFAGTFLYGWDEPFDAMLISFSPIVRLIESVRVSEGAAAELVIAGAGWLWLYAAVGLVLAALGLLVYRRRHSEATGSIVAVGWARPIFRYGVSFCAALALGQLLYYLFFGQYRYNGDYSLPGTLACMAAAGLIGYFAAEMLLRKSFRVWKTGWKGAAVVAAALVALGFALSLDLTGYEGYVPDPDKVESVSVEFNVYTTPGGCYVTRSDPGVIRLATAAHRAIIGDKARQQSLGRSHYDGPADWREGENAGCYYSVAYRMKNGTVVRRSYRDVTICADELGDPASPAAALTALYNDPNVALQRTLNRWGYGEDPGALADLRFTGGFYSAAKWSGESYLGEDVYDLTPAQAKQIYDAVLRDAAAGRLAGSLFKEEARMRGIELYATYLDARTYDGAAVPDVDPDGRAQVTFGPVVTPQMAETLAALRAMGIDVSF